MSMEPAVYIYLNERKLGPFGTFQEADAAIDVLDLDNEEVWHDALLKHGPAFLMLALPMAPYYTLYQATPIARVNDILSNGMVVGAKPHLTAKFDNLEPYGIYLGDTADTVMGFLFEFEEAELLEVTIPFNWTLWADPEIVEMGSPLAEDVGFYISKEPIPASWIKVAPVELKEELRRKWAYVNRKS